MTNITIPDTVCTFDLLVAKIRQQDLAKLELDLAKYRSFKKRARKHYIANPTPEVKAAFLPRNSHVTMMISLIEIEISRREGLAELALFKSFPPSD